MRANIARLSATGPIARSTGPRGRVHSFEPEPENRAALRRNIRLNRYRNVTVHPEAILDESGAARLYIHTENRGDHRVYPDPDYPRDSIEVPTASLDDLFAGHGRLDVVKLDVQGVEWRAVRGMHNVIEDNPAITIVTEFWPEGIVGSGGDPRAFLAELHEIGFAPLHIHAARRTVDCVRDEVLMERCRSAYYINLLLRRPRA